MSVQLVEVWRGDIVECIHRGDIAVTNSAGTLLAYAGDPQKVTYFRSAAKPLQALNVFISGAYGTYRLTSAEVAVICSSHYAEPFHLQAVGSILAKAGLNEQHVLGGTVTSLNPQYALELARKQTALTPLFSDCSGKHAGMLATCVLNKYSLDDYLLADHPVQQEILHSIAEMCNIAPAEIAIGIDGCSAPVHALPLANMAVGFARLANSSLAPKRYCAAAEIIFNAMNERPEMVAGTGGFCTELIRKTKGRLVGKIGAEGVYCIGIRDRDIGVAIKIESGNMAMLPPVAVAVLEQLELLTTEELDRLTPFRRVDNRNDLHKVVGHITPVFSLNTVYPQPAAGNKGHSMKTRTPARRDLPINGKC